MSSKFLGEKGFLRFLWVDKQSYGIDPFLIWKPNNRSKRKGQTNSCGTPIKSVPVMDICCGKRQLGPVVLGAR